MTTRILGQAVLASLLLAWLAPSARAQAVRRPSGQLQQLTPDLYRVVDVGRERLLGPDALLRRIRRHPALVPAPGQRCQRRSGARDVCRVFFVQGESTM